MRRYVEQLKEKPEHVRHRVALGIAGGTTALVGIIWITALAASGSLALTAPAEEADSGIAEARSSFNELVGAVGQGFDPAALGDGADEPELTIVDGGTTTTIAPPQNQTDATVIPF